MKKYKTGLVIGKFYPFHKGHEYLIKSAVQNSEKVTVIVCQTKRYKIPVKVRAQWIKDTFPSVNVKIYRHSIALDSNSTDISQVWAKLTVEFLGFVPDAVFSSEEYGAPYAKYMGSQHVLVDLARRHVPISATKIRSDIYKYWDFLPEITKKYFIKVVVIGAESTGTTTLSRDLGQYYHTPWVPEYGRTYYEGKMTSSKLNSWRTKEFAHIAKIQNQMENFLAKQADKLLICDTNSFATELWHERYVGRMSKKVKRVSSKVKADLYILTNTDIPFVQDGTRDGEHIRQKMHDRFLEELQNRKLNYIVVSGSREKRLKSSITAINKLQKNPR